MPEVPFQILFEDQHLIVLSKPAGLLSQSDISGEPSLVDLLREYFGRHYVGLIHRLDRNTTGLMIVAKRSKSAERLTAQLHNGELTRNYHAILLGELPEGRHRWEHFLIKNEKTNEVRCVPAATPQAKKAVLDVTALRVFSDPKTESKLTWAEFALETGRSHQIRVQSAKEGYPLIGDQKYGTGKSLTLFSRPALHSCKLTFFHPISRENMSFEERYSSDMIATFSALSDT